MDRVTIKVEELQAYERLQHTAMSVVALADTLDNETVVISKDLWDDLRSACKEVNRYPGEVKS